MAYYYGDQESVFLRPWHVFLVTIKLCYCDRGVFFLRIIEPYSYDHGIFFSGDYGAVLCDHGAFFSDDHILVIMAFFLVAMEPFLL